jgi:hypothetical protein
MKYWQITTSRLSKAAKKLVWDDEWHPFESTPNAWYRVWHKRLVQRVNFEDAAEAEQLLPLVRKIEPLESMGRTGGFREEMEIRVTPAGFAAMIPIGYTPEDLKAFERTLARHKMLAEIQGNLLTIMIPFETLDHESLVEVRERLALARQLYEEHR